MSLLEVSLRSQEGALTLRVLLPPRSSSVLSEPPVILARGKRKRGSGNGIFSVRVWLSIELFVFGRTGMNPMLYLSEINQQVVGWIKSVRFSLAFIQK